MPGRRIPVQTCWVLLTSLGLGAQEQAFDVGAFRPPQGWDVAREKGRVTCTVKDLKAGTYVMLAVYDSVASTGNLERDFASEWKAVVEPAFRTAGAPPSVAGRTRGGLGYREGAGTGAWGQAQAALRLAVFSAGERVVSIVQVATHEAAFRARQPALQACLDSVRFVRPSGIPAPGKPAAPAGPPAVAPSGGDVPRGTRGVVGVWMGFKANYPDWEPRPRWFVFYEDGQVFEDIPREGLAGFSRAASQASPAQRPYWGSYAMNGATGAAQRPGSKFPESLRLEAEGKLRIDNDTFLRCRPVDGLRLEGAWTSYSNPQDPALAQLPAGQRPIFHFTRNGRFTDEGVFATFLWTGDRSTDEAGSGSYEVRDYSIVFRFDDGRVKQVALSGMLAADPATSNDIIFIARSSFRKRK
jgi:hypothetical protein